MKMAWKMKLGICNGYREGFAVIFLCVLFSSRGKLKCDHVHVQQSRVNV